LKIFQKTQNLRDNNYSSQMSDWTSTCSQQPATALSSVYRKGHSSETSLLRVWSDRYFATAGPVLWNSLPKQLRQPDITFGQFKWSLKTFMCR